MIFFYTNYFLIIYLSIGNYLFNVLSSFLSSSKFVLFEKMCYLKETENTDLYIEN